MDRRDFLKLSGFFSAAAYVGFNSLGKGVSFPVEAEGRGKLFRGTPDGKIFVSTNQGRDWQLHTNFGSHVSVFSLEARPSDQVRAALAVANYNFELALTPDGKCWKKV
jgi:hypothetical protein